MAEVFYFHVQEDRSIKYKPTEPIMQEDKDVAVWRFRIPKVLNNIDMSAWAWWFVYVNAKNQKFSELLTLTNDIDDPENYCTADYSIGYGISKTPGGFTFALEAINAEQGGEIDGEWHTRTYTHTVTPTLQGNQAEYAEAQSDIISALMQEVRNKVNQLVGGATPTPVASVSAMTDPSKLYLLTTDGNWYYHNGTTFVSGGVYGAGVVDSVPTQGSDNAVSSGGVYSALAGKVDAETGKGLSTNDYSDAEKAKVTNATADLSAMTTATAEDVGKALKAKTVTNGKVIEWEFGEAGGSSDNKVEFTSGYINHSNGVMNINSPSASQNYHYAVVPCSEGDAFIVSATSGRNYPYAWAFTTSNGTIVSHSKAKSTHVENLILWAPAGAEYLVINALNTDSVSYIGLTTDYKFSIIDNMFKFFGNVELIPMQAGFFMKNTSITQMDLNNPVMAEDSMYSYAKVSCVEGDRFIVSGVSGSSYPLAWAFTDSNGVILARAITSKTYSDEHIIAPVGTAHLVVNDTQGKLQYKCGNVQSMIEDACEEIKKEGIKNLNIAFQSLAYPRIAGVKKSDQLSGLHWTPKKPVPVKGGAEYYPADTERVHMLYSDTYEINKVVGFDVSLRTFMTAVNNPYSLLYTENLNANHSESAYGITYHGDGNAGAYYGVACNQYSMQVCGSVIPYNTSDMAGWAKDEGIFIEVYDQSANGVELLDILRRSGHCMSVTGITKDANGIVTGIRATESAVEGVKNTKVYTPEEFNQTVLGSYTLYRFRDIYKNTKYEQSPFVTLEGEEAQTYTYNDDICTFAGDYACFGEGDLLHINYTKGSYTQMQIYKNDALLETIALESSADVHDVDLTSKGYTYGKYKARLTDGTNHSDYTCFEILNADVSYANNVLSFSSANATPLYWGYRRSNGYTKQKYLIDSTPVSVKEPDDSLYNNLMVVFGGEYGRITKVVSMT